MKKLMLFLFILIIIPFKTYALSASSVIAMDLDNGRVLYGYSINDKKLIASTTKIMTAIIAIEKGNLDDVIEVDDIIYESTGSSIYLEIGNKITLRDLLYGLLLRSGNDAALLISKYISGSVDEFVYLMNEYANNIGMNNTTFYNPHGLEDNNGVGNISTSYDMALLTKYAINNSTFRDIFKTKKYSANINNKKYTWNNKNKLLKYSFITGGKTGYTKKAKRTLVSTGSKNNINIVVVTLNDKNDWEDHINIYNKIYDTYEKVLLLNKNDYKINSKYYKNGSLYIKNNYYMSLKKEEIKHITLYENIIELDNYNNDSIVGYVDVYLDDKLYHKEPIYIKIENKKHNNIFKKWFNK